MERRAFLGASTAALLAGCGDTQSETTNRPNSQPNETEPSRKDKRPQIQGDAEIVIQNSEWIENGTAIEFQVQNNGTTPSGPVTVVLRWFDESENYIGSDAVSIGSLLDGSNWLGAVQPVTRFEATSYEISVEYNEGRESVPDSVELLEYEIDEAEQAITGRVENLTEEYSSIRGEASTYNSGWISHIGSVGDSEVPPGATWRFYIPLTSVDHTAGSICENVDIRFMSSA